MYKFFKNCLAFLLTIRQFNCLVRLKPRRHFFPLNLLPKCWTVDERLNQSEWDFFSNYFRSLSAPHNSLSLPPPLYLSLLSFLPSPFPYLSFSLSFTPLFSSLSLPLSIFHSSLYFPLSLLSFSCLPFTPLFASLSLSLPHLRSG